MHEAGQDGRLGRLSSQRARPCLPRAGHSPLIVTDEKRGQGRRGPCARFPDRAVGDAATRGGCLRRGGCLKSLSLNPKILWRKFEFKHSLKRV